MTNRFGSGALEETTMGRINAIAGALAALGMLVSLPASAKTEMGSRGTPGARMPVGDYLCGLGSYKGRHCTMAAKDKHFELTIPAEKGHSIPLKAQVLGTDTAGRLLLVGKMLTPNRVCSADEPSDCNQQPMVVILQKAKNGTWRGNLSYWIYRTDKKGRYRHGVSEVFVMRAKKR